VWRKPRPDDMRAAGPITLLALLGLGSPQPVDRFPGASWERASPADVGMSDELLEAALGYAGGLLGGGSRCVSVHRHGYLVAERYYEGDESSRWITWSTSKAIAATLVGAAERAGQLDHNDTAELWIPEWRNSEAEDVTVDMLLRHDSGRYYDPISDFVVPQLVGLNGSQPATQTEFAVTRAQTHAPGTVDQYNQMAFQALEPVIRGATGFESVQAFSERQLFAPLAMEDDPFWEERGAFTQFLFPATDGIRNGPLVYGATNAPSFEPFQMRMLIILPRQARDKHRES
jgi:CubicO group peptidase (beta-lactamase class C family)